MLLVAVLLTGCRPDPGTPLRVPGEKYAPMVSAFYAGTSALQVGDNPRATARLEEATRIVPEEPAPWANLAVLHLRSREYEKADAALEKARSLAPPTGHLEWLAGLLAAQQGRTEPALRHLRRAVQLEPGNLRARYSLVEEIARQPGPESERESARELEAILAADPGNLVALLELARRAARDGSAPRLREVLSALRGSAAAWPLEARAQLDTLDQAVAAGRLNAGSSLTTQLAVLGNLLKPSPAYQRSASALRNLDAAVGRPLERFLRLPSPSATPAPPDMALAFTNEPLADLKAEWASALLLQPGAPAGTGAAIAPDGPPALLIPQGSAVLLVADLTTGADRRRIVRLQAPGGPEGQGLAPDGALAIDWNNDFRPDLALAGPGGLRLYRQESASRWQDVTARAGLPAATLRAAYTGAWAVDIDLDGDLDISLGTRAAPPVVLRNTGMRPGPRSGPSPASVGCGASPGRTSTATWTRTSR